MAQTQFTNLLGMSIPINTRCQANNKKSPRPTASATPREKIMH
jgi:hypothetical protein